MKRNRQARMVTEAGGPAWERAICGRSATDGGVQTCSKILKSKLKNSLKTEVNDRLPFGNGLIGLLGGGPGARAEKDDETLRRRPRFQSTTGAALSRRKGIKVPLGQFDLGTRALYHRRYHGPRGGGIY